MKPVRPIRYIILCLSILMVIAAVHPAPAETGLQRIKKKNELLVAIPHRNVYPYSYKNKRGDLVGSDVEMVKDIASKLNVKLTFDDSARSSEDIIRLVMDRRVDLGVGGLKILIPEAKRVLYSAPYLSMDYTLVVNRLKLAGLVKARSPIDQIRASCARIGIPQKNLYLDYAQTIFPKAQILQYENENDIVDGILHGKLIAGFLDEVEAKALYKAAPNLGLNLMYIQLSKQTDELGFVFSWDNTHLRSWIDLYFYYEKPNRPQNVDELLRRYPLP